MSHGKKKGRGNAKADNRYLSWTFSEAVHFTIRFSHTQSAAFYERKKSKTNGIVAMRSVAYKLARASYRMLQEQIPYDAKRAFG